MRARERGAALVPLAIGLLLVLNSLGAAHGQEPPTINPEPASTVIGQTSFTSYASDFGPSGLSTPEFLAFDHSGDLWVSDYNNSYVSEYVPPFRNGSSAVLEVGSPNFSTNGCSNQGAGDLCNPNGIAFDPSGNLWVADGGNNTVDEFKAPFTTGENASIVIGEQSDGQVNGSNLGTVYGIAFDRSGDLWVADATDNRVLEYKAPLSTGEAASLVLGQTSLTGTTDDQAQANMSGPEDVAFDSNGNLWVVDTDASRVLEFTQPFSNGEAASLVIGEPNFTSFNGNDTQSLITLPEAIAFDNSGDLWVADSGNSRVLEFAPPFSTGMNASDLIGQYSYFFGGPNATRTQLGYPEGLAFDSSNNLWVADPGFSRVLEYNDPLKYSAATTTATSTTTSTSTTTTSATSTASSITSTASSQSTASLTTTSSSSSKSGSGVPVFPYEFGVAAVFTVLLAASYLLVRRRMAPRSPL